MIVQGNVFFTKVENFRRRQGLSKGVRRTMNRELYEMG